MALTVPEQNASYPLAAYNYRVTVGDATLSCSEVTGLSVDYETVTYRHGLSFWEGEVVKRYRLEKFINIKLKRAIVHKLTALYDWLKANEMKTMDISLCDETGLPAVTWHIGRALPVKLEAPSFQASSNEAAVEELEVMVSRVSIEHH